MSNISAVCLPLSSQCIESVKLTLISQFHPSHFLGIFVGDVGIWNVGGLGDGMEGIPQLKFDCEAELGRKTLSA